MTEVVPQRRTKQPWRVYGMTGEENHAMENTSDKSKLIPQGAVTRHPVAWVMVVFCVFFTSASVFSDMLIVMGWEDPARRRAYFVAGAMTIFSFVYARYRQGKDIDGPTQ